MDTSPSTVLAAINANLDSVTAKSARDAAFEYLEALKQQEGCLNAMLYILFTESADHNEWNRQLALSILDDWIKLWWNRIPEDAQRYIREQTVTLLTNPAVSASRGLRTKLAVILSEIAQRQYPQHWPTFLDDIVGLWISTTSPGQREVCIMCLEYLVQDCVDGDFNSTLPSQRRQDILSGLQARLAPLLQTCHAFLVQCEVQVKSGDAAQAQEGTALGNAALRLVSALSVTAKPAEICAPSSDFGVLALQLLSSPALQVEAVNFLHELTSQKLEPALFASLLEAISSIQVTVLPSDLEDSITFQRVYAEAVYQLLGLNASVAMEASFLASERMVQVLGRYMTIMSQLLEQPSRRLAADVLNNWLRIFKEKAILHLPWAGAVMAHVLRVYLRKTHRILWNTESDEPEEEEAQVEFNDFAEYNEFRNNFNCQLRLLADVAAQRFPLVAAQFLSEEVHKLLALCSSGGGGGAGMVPPPGYQAADSEFVRTWDSILIMWGNIFTKTQYNELETREPEVRRTLTAILEAVLQWEPSSCAPEGPHRDTFIYLKVKAASDAAALLRLSAPHLNYTVQVLMGSYGAGEFPGVVPAPSLVKRNRSISASIAQLCDTCVAEILQQEAVVQAVAQQLVAWLDRPDVSRDDQSSFREALVAISDKVADPEGKMNLLRTSLGGLLGYLQQMSESHFLDSSALLQAGSADLSQPAGHARILDTTAHALGSLLSASRRVGHPLLPLSVWTHAQSVGLAELMKVFPFVSMWQGVFASLLVVSRAIHGIWDPVLRMSLSESNPLASGLYLPTVDNVRLRAWDGTDKAESAPFPTSAPVAAPLDVLQNDLAQCRQQLYHLLGQSCLHKAFYASPLRPQILSHLLLAAQHMENTHLAYLMVRFVEPFVLNAPPVYYREVGDFLAAFLPSVLTRLTVAWSPPPPSSAGVSTSLDPSLNARELYAAAQTNFQLVVFHFCSLPQNSNYAGVGAEGLENARLSVVGELTRAFCELLSTLGLCRGYLSQAVPTTPGAAGNALGAGAGAGAAEESEGKGKGKGKGKGHGNGGAMQAGVKKPSKITPVALWEPEKDTDESREAQKQARRAALHHLIFGDESSNVTAPFLQAVTVLLTLPDSGALKTGILLARAIAAHAEKDSRLVPCVGKDFFSAALQALVMQHKWSAGLEWELLDLLQESFCMLVLGLELSPGATPTEAARLAKQQQRQQQQLSQGVDYGSPVKALLQVGIRMPAIENLQRLLLGCAKQKKRREYFKDFMTPIIEHYAAMRAAGGSGGIASTGESSGASTDSLFAKKASAAAVQDIRAQTGKPATKKQVTAAAGVSGGAVLDGQFTLASLFEDDDNL
jgi:hypothetical protein